MKYLIPFLLCAFFLLNFSIETAAQDKHFSQFYAAPLTLNPALTGNFDGRYRATAIYRNQWFSILENPFSTISASFDMNFGIGKRRIQEDLIGAGVMIVTDRVGQSAITTNTIGISGAFHKSLNRNNTQYLSAGFQIGVMQRSINYESLTFNDQFNGTTGYTNPTGEQLPRNNFTVEESSAGIYWINSPKDRVSFQVGGSVHHLTQPNVSFYEGGSAPENKLYMRYSGLVGASFPISSRMDMMPRMLVYMQGSNLEMNVGTNLKLLLDGFGDRAVYIGGWLRPVGDVESSIALDAAVLLAGFEFNSFRVGASYDLNLSTLSQATQGVGAFEISLSYIGSYGDSGRVVCPSF